MVTYPHPFSDLFDLNFIYNLYDLCNQPDKLLIQTEELTHNSPKCESHAHLLTDFCERKQINTSVNWTHVESD